MAHSQTAGRGRHGRTWVSPAGNLYLSIVVRPNLPAERSGELAFVTAVALHRAINDLHPAGTLALKWPNDVLINDAKLCGILIENHIEAAQIAFSIVGVGINVASSPAGTSYPATSLIQCGIAVDPESLAGSVLRQLQSVRGVWSKQGFEHIASEWTQAAWRRDARVVIDDGAERKSGIFVGLSRYGALRLSTDSGIAEISSGSLLYESAA